ncbi:MAG: hypothetical protein ABI867_27225 [Kofleriaceae bacterium]
MRAALVVALVACHAPPPERLVRVAAPELEQAIAVAGGILGRTHDGALVRFDAALGSPRTEASIALAIAADGDHAYVGLANGTIGELDPVTLEIRSTLTKVTGAPLWLSIHGDERLVVVRAGDDSITLELDRGGEHRSIPIPSDGGSAMALRAPSVFLRDGDRLWFGVNAGEWGGSVGVVDLTSGTVTHVARPGPVFGLAAAHGQILAHGGLVHMSSFRGYVLRLAPDPKLVWERTGGRKRPTTKPPALPVHWLAPHGTGYLAVVWNEVYAVDATFTTWTQLAAMPARDKRGHLATAYPSPIAVIELAGRLVLVTHRNGLYVLPLAR